MMCCLKMSKLDRKRQEPSSRSKISLCCQFCNNSCKAVKNLLWHRRDECADMEVIGWSRWLYCSYLGRHHLSGVWPSGSSFPWGPEWGEGSLTPLLSPDSPMMKGQNGKANISTVRKPLQRISSHWRFLPPICSVAIKGGCVYGC